MAHVAPLSFTQLQARPWRRAAVWLLTLSTVFYLSYGLANWLASRREEVPAIVFAWEHGIPFIAWTIVPYFSTHLFFALSFFVCRTEAELDSHARRLLSAQVIAVACFIAFPLRVSFERPEAIDGFGSLFDMLRLFDMPFNQAPSLHIATTAILFDLYVRTLPRWTATAVMLWALLVAASVLTTYQHHFIDVPTGFVLGLACIWMWPLDGGNRLADALRPWWRFSK